VLKRINKPHCPSLQDSYNTEILQTTKKFCTTVNTGFQPKCKLHQCTIENISKYHKTDTSPSVNGDDASDNAP
jgi:hypothetical protein